MGLLLILLLGLPLSAPAQEAQEPDVPVFRSDVRWVRLDVQAGEKNRLLTGLTKEDFVVFDEGRPQPIAYFGRESEPLDVLLLLDVSGSMTRFLEQMASTAREALRQLQPDDRVGVMLFARRAEVREDLTPERAKVEADLRDAVREKNLGSGTLINTAIIAAAGYIGKQPRAAEGAGPRPGRRAILMVTDNMGLNYQVPDDHVIQALFAADTVLNAIVVGKGERPARPKPGQYLNPDFTPSDVFRVAEETGGEAVKAQHAGASFREMIDGIRSRYSIQYPAPVTAVSGAVDGKPAFRRVRVELSPPARKRYPNAWVRARTGYIVSQ